MLQVLREQHCAYMNELFSALLRVVVRSEDTSYTCLQEKKAEMLRKLEEATLAERGSQKLAQEIKMLQKEADTVEEANAGLLTDLNALKASSKYLLESTASLFCYSNTPLRLACQYRKERKCATVTPVTIQNLSLDRVPGYKLRRGASP